MMNIWDDQVHLKHKMIKKFVSNNSYASLRMKEYILIIKKEKIRTILHEDLSKTKVSVKFIPHILTEEQKAIRTPHCIDIISAAGDDLNIMKSIN